MASTSSIDDLESQIPTILRSNKDYFQFFVMTLQLSSHPDGQYSILERRCSMAKRVGTSDHYNNGITAWQISAISLCVKIGLCSTRFSTSGDPSINCCFRKVFLSKGISLVGCIQMSLLSQAVHG